MPVAVDIPIAVRVASAPSEDELAALERRIGDGARRALAQIDEQVLAPRGGRRPVRIEMSQPSIVDQGDRLSAAGHDELLRSVERGVAYAVESSALATTPDRPARPRRRAAERPDAARLSSAGYRVPSFDTTAPAEVPIEEGDEYRPIPSFDQALGRLWDAHRQRFGAVWDPLRFGYPGWYGTYATEGALVPDALVYLSSVESIGEDGYPEAYTWQRGPLHMMAYVEEQDSVVSESVPSGPMGHYLLTRTAEAATVENLLRHAEENAADEEVPLDPEVRARMAAAVADPSAIIFTLADGARVSFMAIVPGSEQTGGIAHSPIRFIAEQNVLGEGGATGAGAQQAETGDGGRRGAGDQAGGGSRPRGGPLGQGAEGEGRVWPLLGLGGEPLVCQAFRGEPPLSQLQRGAASLEAKVRSIAQQLELEYCGYAGMFCLNAAKAIGARAHAVGVTSARSTTTTRVTVRGDGAGNHGFVDIEPGDAPELQYLQTLGDLAVQVNQLADLIGSVYLERANADLIFREEDREGSPDAAGWLLRFLVEMDELDTSCMWLFAECCRVILLQQLRSSNQGITGRQTRFEDTLTAFREKLDILGGTVVEISVLRQAIGHAERYDLSGSVRSVLSHRPPGRYMGRGEMYEPPAPITFVADEVVTRLDDARIEARGDDRVALYGRRTWTDPELEQALAQRRRFLNLTDPMFLQVANLDALYTRFKRDPETARTYLRDLLAEMLEANTQMTAETAEPDEGAFFALEASQYVKANGGWNSRGLKYDLQGMHDLADAVLRPYAQGTDAYRVGINEAIGIKARWDDFVTVFSTAGIITLALLCAPLGAVAAGAVTGVAGLALTAYDLSEAERQEDLYRSLEDPEAILHWQDVELARMMAGLSVAFSVFDVVGVAKAAKAIVRGAEVGLREAAEQGLRGAVRSSLAASRRAVLANMTEEVVENALKQAVTEAAVLAASNALLPAVVTPVLVPWLRSVAATHGTLSEVDAALGTLAAGLPDPVPAPPLPESAP